MLDDEIPLTRRSVTVESKEVKKNDWTEETFFPFQEDHEREQVRPDQLVAAFPKLGIGALVGALTLIALSGAILLVIQGPGKVVSDWTVHVHDTHQYVTIPKPAAWLSGILSAITVCFHIALSEGLNIAWWYHVRQKNTTVRDLHNIWGHGTSTWTVAKSGAKDIKDGFLGLINRSAPAQPHSRGRHFSYVALATLFVATIPLNGFLLQNAVIVELQSANLTSTITLPMLNGDNFNSLAQVTAIGDSSDGGVSNWSPALGVLSQLVTSKVTATADLGSFNTTCLDSCKTTVRGMGFKIHCEDSLQRYDIPVNCGNYCPGGVQPDLSSMINGTNVVEVAVTYSYQITNTVTVRSMWKDSATCTGNYRIQTCRLDLATVEYPVTINSGIKEVTQNGLRDTTMMTLDIDLLKESPKVVTLAHSAYIPHTANSIYPVAGLAGLFAQTLNGSINLSYNGVEAYGGFELTAQGMFAQQQLASSGKFSGQSDSCQGYIGNVSQQALATIQSMMFQLGAYNWLSSFGDPGPNGENVGSITSDESIPDFIAANTPHPVAVQSYERNEYIIVWRWYFGAMAVTIVISLFILPTFWGYWRLGRKTTMSPFETARAFHAPMLYQQDSSIVSDELIKRVGDVQINRDLPVVSMPVESVPVESVPVRSVPVRSVPIVSVPAVSVPLESVPVKSVPAMSVPVVSMPAVSVPVLSVPVLSVPVDSEPFMSMPGLLVPLKSERAVSKPAMSVPVNLVPVVSKPAVSMPSVSKPVEPVPAVSKPVESVPAKLVPAVSKPGASKLVASKLVASKPVESKPVVSKPSVSKPGASKPVVSEPAKSVPVEPVPAKLVPAVSKSVASKPVESEPAKSAPAESEPAKLMPAVSKPVASKTVGQKQVESKSVESKPVEPKPVGPKPVGPKPVEPKPVEPKPVEPKPVEPKPVEPKPVEPKPVESELVESLPAKSVPVKPVPSELVPDALVPAKLVPAKLMSAVSKPVASKPVQSKPVQSKPLESEPAKSAPVESVPVVSKPAVSESAVSKSAVSEPVMLKPAVSKPAVSVPAVLVPAVLVPAVSEPIESEPGVSKLAVSKPVESDPVVSVPVPPPVVGPGVEIPDRTSKST